MTNEIVKLICGRCGKVAKAWKEENDFCDTFFDEEKRGMFCRGKIIKEPTMTTPNEPMTWEQALEKAQEKSGIMAIRIGADVAQVFRHAAQLWNDSVKAHAESKWISVEDGLPEMTETA